MKSPLHTLLITCVLAALATNAILAAGEEDNLELQNEIVLKVGTIQISKTEVESHMYEVVARLRERKEQWQASGRWDKDAEATYAQIYKEEFLNALRETVKERLMLAEAKDKKLEYDKRRLEKRTTVITENVRKSGILGKPGYTYQDIKEIAKNQILIEEFKSSLVTMVDLPNRVDVERYYKEHLAEAEYQRGAGAKVYVFKLSLYEVNGLGVRSARDPAKVRKDIEEFRKRVSDEGQSVRDLVRDSEDEETRKTGGLVKGSDGDDYMELEQNRPIKEALRGVDVKGCSPIFQTGEFLAFAYLDDRRPAGPRPLDGPTFEKIQNLLIDKLSKQREAEWFHKALERTVVRNGLDKPISLKIFFPDDPSAVSKNGNDTKKDGPANK